MEFVDMEKRKDTWIQPTEKAYGGFILLHPPRL
jgi:hypothetical protein